MDTFCGVSYLKDRYQLSQMGSGCQVVAQLVIAEAAGPACSSESNFWRYLRARQYECPVCILKCLLIVCRSQPNPSLTPAQHAMFGANRQLIMTATTLGNSTRRSRILIQHRQRHWHHGHDGTGRTHDFTDTRQIRSKAANDPMAL